MNIRGKRERAEAEPADGVGAGTLSRRGVLGGLAAFPVMYGIGSATPAQAATVLDYGLGVWIHRDGDVLEIHGYDAGVSFYSLHHPASATTCTAVSNTGKGTRALEELLERRVRH